MYRVQVHAGGKVINRGTGWFLRPDLIVTAFHVVGQKGLGWRDEGMESPCDYLLELDRTLQLDRKLIPSCFDAEADVALLECATPPEDVVTCQLATTLTINASWKAEGFPDANSGDRFVLRGTVDAFNNKARATDKALQLHVAKGNAKWEGMSGSAICVGADVIGVLVQMPRKTNTAFAATTDSVSRLLDLHDAAHALEKLLLRSSQRLKVLQNFAEEQDGVGLRQSASKSLTKANVIEHLKRRVLRGGPTAMLALLDKLKEHGVATETVRALLHKSQPLVIEEAAHEVPVTEVVRQVVEELKTAEARSGEHMCSGVLLPMLPPFSLGYPHLEINMLDRRPKRGGGETLKTNVSLIVGPVNRNPGNVELLNYVLDSVLRNFVGHVGIHPDHEFYGAIGQLPPRLKRHRIIDITESHDKVPFLRELFEPIEDEFNVHLIDVNFTGTTYATCHQETILAINRLYSSMHTFFIGIKYHLQIYIALEETKDAIDLLYLASRNDWTRSNLATLKAILDSYKQCSIDGMQFKSDAKQRLELLLQGIMEHILENTDYQQSTIIGHSLGDPMRVAGALAQVGECTRRVLENPSIGSYFQPMPNTLQVPLDFSRRLIPTPNSEAFSELIEPPFLPPIGPIRMPGFNDWIQLQAAQQAVRLGLPIKVFEPLFAGLGKVRPA